jgi:hypothetical protein
MFHVSPDMRSHLLPAKSFKIDQREKAERWARSRANAYRRTFVLWQLDRGIPTRLMTFEPVDVPF